MQEEEQVTCLELHTQAALLHKLPEYATALALLDADPIIGPQLEKMVGTVSSARGVYKDRLIADIATRSLRTDEWGFDEGKFRDAYSLMEAEFHMRDVEFTTVAPVTGVATAPLLRFGSLELDRMTEEEAGALLSTGLLRSSMGSGSFALTNTEHVLRFRHKSPKVVYRPGDRPPDQPSATGPNVAQECEDVISAMRLFKNEAVGIAGVLTLGGFGGGGSVTWGLPWVGVPIHHPGYRLDEGEGQRLVSLWSKLKSIEVRKRDFIGTAIRRYSYAGERSRVEDRFVDLMIAAEALFLGEQGKGTSGEIAYRISMRFAHFVDTPGTTRRVRYQQMKEAYGLRSAVVHGSSVRKPKAAPDLAVVTARLSEHLRLALMAMIGEAEAHPERIPLIDWDQLIVGPVSEGSGDVKG